MSKRFGLVYVDYAPDAPGGALRRIPKSSYPWYGQVIRSNAVQELE